MEKIDILVRTHIHPHLYVELKRRSLEESNTRRHFIINIESCWFTSFPLGLFS